MGAADDDGADAEDGAVSEGGPIVAMTLERKVVVVVTVASGPELVGCGVPLVEVCVSVTGQTVVETLMTDVTTDTGQSVTVAAQESTVLYWVE